LYHAIAQGSNKTSIESFSGTSQTDSSGSATLEFSSVNGAEEAYSTIVYSSLSGLVGVGYHSSDTAENNKVIPFVEDYANRIVLFAHSYDVHTFPNPAALHYSASYFSLTQDFQLTQIQLANASGVLTYGGGKPYLRVQIPAETGILVVAYRSNEGYGIALMPWGISALGFSITFGGNPSSADWVSTELRQVTINQVSYQVKVAVWSTKSYQPWGYNP
jgi:hypothetical protein